MREKRLYSGISISYKLVMLTADYIESINMLTAILGKSDALTVV